MLLGELHKRPAFEQSLQSLHQKYQQLLKRVLWRGERQLGRLVSASGPLRRSGEERAVGKINPSAVMTAVTRLWTVAGLTREHYRSDF
jgi:hypothetical protein